MRELLIIALLMVSSTALAAEDTLRHPAWMDTVPGLKTGPCRDRYVGTRTDMVDHTVIRPIRSLLRPVEWVRSIGYRSTLIEPRQAGDLTPLEEVHDSGYFVNRLGKRRLVAEEIRNGALENYRPAGPWRVERIDLRSPVRLLVSATDNTRWELIFDSPSEPELATGAQLVSSRLLWAAGYFVRPSALVAIRPEDLAASNEMVWIDRYGEYQSKGPAIADAIAKLTRRDDGSIRAVAVMEPPGDGCGPFSYVGGRSDDPQGYIENYHRRSLRGLRWFAAWLNYIESSQRQTLTWWLPAGDDGQGAVVHFLEGLERTLGSNHQKARSPRDGHGYYVNPWSVLRQIVTLGLYKEDDEEAVPFGLKGYGYFDSLRFRPDTWRGYFPNPAFMNATELDGYWAAKILTSFRTEDIDAAISAADFSDPATRAELLRTLVERRDKIAAYLFRGTFPADNFRIEPSAEGNWDFRFTDLAVDRGLVRHSQARYKFLLRPKGLVEADIVSVGGLINRFIDNGSSTRILIDFELASRIRRYPPVRISSGPVRWEILIVGRYEDSSEPVPVLAVKIPEPAETPGTAMQIIDRFEVPAPESTLQGIGDRVRLGYERTVGDTVRLSAPRSLAPSFIGTQPPPVRVELIYDPETDSLKVAGWSR